MNENYGFEIGDAVVLIEQKESNQPPVGTTGIIYEFYAALGGPAARIHWDSSSQYQERALLRFLQPANEPEIDESDINLDILLGI